MVRMTAWKLGFGSPLSLTLVADARLSEPNYVNDQIWKLHLGGGEPPALGLQTTFGLRARSMRLFPRFSLQGQGLTDPAQFHQPPTVDRCYPNYLRVNAMPFAGLHLRAEYWCPDSDVVCGRSTLQNQGLDQVNCRLDWIALLAPLGEGQGMSVAQMGVNWVLQGQTADLAPICLMTGGPAPGSGSYPALTIDVELAPGTQREFTWALASLESAEESLQKARQTLDRPWEAEIARLELVNESQTIKIETGDADWDAALALSQKVAHSLFFPGSESFPHPSFVINREPEQGYSIRGEGTDYPYLWNGQTTFDAYYLSTLLLPGDAERLKGVLLNFLTTQSDDGAIDWKPGLAGQLSKRAAQPVLATLAQRIAQNLPDDEANEFLSAAYPHLVDFLRYWLSPQNDRDHDGIPEWTHPLQSGLDETPLFDRWQPQSQGVAIYTIETPALAAMLYRECRSLIKMARSLRRRTDLRWLENQAGRLRTAIEAMWDDKASTYRYRDFHTHHSLPGQTLLTFNRAGEYAINQRWRQPRRLMVHICSSDQNTYALQLILRGNSKKGPVEESITTGQMSWNNGQGRYTSQHAYTYLKEMVVITQVEFSESRLATVDLTQEDISLLLPLWSGAADRRRAGKLIERTIRARYWQPFGLPLCPSDPTGVEFGAQSVHMPWNQLIGEGLLRYGERKLAAELVTRLMTAVVNTLKEQHCFRAVYHPVHGTGSGEPNPLYGLAPVGLFLQTLGLRKISPTEVILEDLNPFEREVTVQYRGVTVRFLNEERIVTFANGQTVSVKGPGLHIVTLRSSRA